MNGLQRKGDHFTHTKTVVKNPFIVRISHVRRHMKGDGLQNQTKIFPAIFNVEMSWEGAKTVQKGQKLPSPNFANVSSCHKNSKIFFVLFILKQYFLAHKTHQNQKLFFLRLV